MLDYIVKKQYNIYYYQLFNESYAMTKLDNMKYLSDYQQPTYWSNSINLNFDILENTVIVTSKTQYIKNQQSNSSVLTLNGSSKLISVSIDDTPLHNYQLNNDELILNNLPMSFELTIETEVDAFNNKSCMGLYASQGSLFTQCEPEGFRKITYYQDRPDVMAKFTTTIIADEDKYPILLSNGNQISREKLANGKIKVVWQDPFKKPSYLFALVAGKFSVISDTFKTSSGRNVDLEVYSDVDSISQCQHCLESLKKAMMWDEQRFNLEYDLDRYMIVASGDFNMGAMENKGLNIFNTKYVLADSKTATDTDFINVEAVVGHEYFHNWTGNRVTCRDWFQLSLKEGLTVFRDQEFTSDLHSRAVERIQEVKDLRQGQFPEDNSALSHPVRPESYLEINNFYTMTVYEKGAEVVRMYQTILGKAGFEKGLKLYFARHDGSAVTCDDFAQAMADANNFDLSQFMLWYSQSGTPNLEISDHYDSEQHLYTLNIKQILKSNASFKAMLIPVEIGLITNDGQELPCEIVQGRYIVTPEQCTVLLVDDFNTKFTFKVNQQPTPSLLRNFSAPVIVNYPYTLTQLLNLAAHDNNSFNRWEAIQSLYKQTISEIYHADKPELVTINQKLIAALTITISDQRLDPSMRALIATLPSFAELSSLFEQVEITKLNNAINQLRNSIANSLEQTWQEIIKLNQTNPYNFADAGKRALKNVSLMYLMSCNNHSQHILSVSELYKQADNMTDKIGALVAINNSTNIIRDELLADFDSSYHNYPLVMDKWFMLQSQSQRQDTLQQVIKLTTYQGFDNTNPNKLYALIRGFTTNSLYFHTKEGYNFIANEILRIDKFNSGVASRIAHSFSSLSNLDNKYKELARPILSTILTEQGLSKDVYELISKTLNQLN